MHTLKKLFGLLLLAVCTQSYAQEILVLNGKQYRVADIENITVTMTKPLLPDVLATHAEYSIFSKALELTGLADTLAYWNTFKTLEETGVSGRPGGGWNGPYYVPEECKIKYTLFAVTDEALKKYGINSVADLKTKCVEWYADAAFWYDYPGKTTMSISTGDDYTYTYNVLNMFMRYHIIKSGAPVSRLLYEQNTANDNWNFAFGGEPHEYYETLLPHTLMKIWQPLYQNTGAVSNIWINRWRQNNTLTDEVGTFGTDATHQILDTGSLVVRDQSDIYALNGYIHTIDRPMLYNADVVHGVLNERMRVDAGSILHELSNNSIRFATYKDIGNMNMLGDDGNMTRIPLNYFENLVAYSDFELGWYTQGAWRAWDSDQLVTWYPVDMGIRLPSVPSGTYEIRIIYPPMTSNGTIRSFIGTSTDTLSMQPLASFDATRPDWDYEDRQAIGFLYVDEFDDYGVASDSVLHSNGYMRAPASFSRGTYNVVKGRISAPEELLYISSASCRYEEGYGLTMIRKILGTVEIDQENNYWLRINQVVTPEQFKAMGSRLENVAFAFDFIELVPISVVDSPDFEEDWY